MYLDVNATLENNLFFIGIIIICIVLVFNAVIYKITIGYYA